MVLTPKIREQDISAFYKCIQYNRKVVKKALKERSLPNGQKLWMAETDKDGYLRFVAPGSHCLATLANKIYDLVAAALVGALAFKARTGADAVQLEGSVMVPIELKLAMPCKLDFWQTEQGTIYSGVSNTPNDKNALRSSISGHYEIHNNLIAKCLRTFLVVVDRTTFEVVTIKTIQGNEVIERLEFNRQTGQPRDKSVRKREIKLSAFVNDGVTWDIGRLMLGLEVWESEIRKIAPVLKTNEVFEKPPAT